MNILFLDLTFPGKFQNLLKLFKENSNNQTAFIYNHSSAFQIPNVITCRYNLSAEEQPEPYTEKVEHNILHGIGGFRAAEDLYKNGFTPDLIITNSENGYANYLKDLFPKIPLYCFFNWYEKETNQPYFPDENISVHERHILTTNNWPILLSLHNCDYACVPTKWQKQQFPREYQNKLTVIPEGINTAIFKPLKNKAQSAKKIITYFSLADDTVNDFLQFILGLAVIFRTHPEYQAVILDEKPQQNSFKFQLLESLKSEIDTSRIHLTGYLPEKDYIDVLQRSSVHVYLTRPAKPVSQSLLQAMSVGCPVVASNTPPAQEFITDGVNGILTDYLNPLDIAEKVLLAAQNLELAKKISLNAHSTIKTEYELNSCLKKQVNWLLS